MSCLLIFTSIYPLTRLTGLAVEMYRMKRVLNFLETHTLLIQQKITQKVGLYTNNTLKKLFPVIRLPWSWKFYHRGGGGGEGAPGIWGEQKNFWYLYKGETEEFYRSY